MNVRFILDWRNTYYALETAMREIPAIARRIELQLGDWRYKFVISFDRENSPLLKADGMLEITVQFEDKTVHEGDEAKKIRHALNKLEPKKELGWRKLDDV